MEDVVWNGGGGGDDLGVGVMVQMIQALGISLIHINTYVWILSIDSQ